MKLISPRPGRRRAGAILAVAFLVFATPPGKADEGAVAFGMVGNLSVEINWGVLDTLGPPRAAPAARPVLFIPVVSASVGEPGPSVAPATIALAPPPELPPLTVPPLPAPPPAAEPPLPATEPMPAPEPPPEPEIAALPEPVEPVPAEPVPAAPLEGAEAVTLTTPEATAPEPLDEAEPAVASLGATGVPVDLTSPGLVLAVGFAADDAELGAETIRALDVLVVAMLADEGARIQLMAYAGAQIGSASAARRLSLSRALAVRGYLIERGVRSTRIDVRALGDNVNDGPPERVDIVALPR